MEETIYWVPDGLANASPRENRMGRVITRPRPGTSSVVPAMAPAQPTYVTAPPQYGPPPGYGGYPGYPAPAGYYGGGGWSGRQNDWQWGQPPPATLGGFFGQIQVGSLVEMATQVLAALQTLPVPPSPTESASTDVANLVTYQSALATHAKRDEQIRTLGQLAGKLLVR